MNPNFDITREGLFQCPCSWSLPFRAPTFTPVAPLTSQKRREGEIQQLYQVHGKALPSAAVNGLKGWARHLSLPLPGIKSPL